MPKNPTYPTCLDEVKTITTGWLRQRGYLGPHYYRLRGSLAWSRGGEPCGSISIMVDTDGGFIELSYLSAGKPICYRIKLESRPSNLGIGKVWYFICPATGRRCRTLYEYGDYFYSRYAIPDAMYSSQTESKRTRSWLRAFRLLSLSGDFLRKRHSRTHYDGKITRRYQKILNRESRFNPNRIREALDLL